MAKRKELTCSDFIRLHKNSADVKARMQERDARLAADTRTPAQVWLGDPPPGRSALHQVPHVGHPLQGPAPRRSAGTRVDLWKSR
jgi:hypothetical protein